MFVYVYVFMYVCMHMCIYVCIYLAIYLYFKKQHWLLVEILENLRNNHQFHSWKQ